MKHSLSNKDNLKIRPISEEDFPQVLKWSKDERFCLANGWELNRKEQELYSWWLYCVNHSGKNFLRLGIELENKLIGYVDLANMKENTAELGIAIGDSSLWGKGMGSEAILHMIDYAALKLGISNFEAETNDTNIGQSTCLKESDLKK